MNSQNDKEGLRRDRAAIIGGIFAVLAACVGGVFLLLNTMIDNGVIFVGISNPNSQPTATASQFQEPTTVSSNPNVAPTNQPASISTTSASEQTVNQNNSSDDKWACIQQADSTQKSTWETCWRYIQIDNAGGIAEALKENANAIEWIGPTDLSYTTIGQYHSDYMSEWYIWANQKKSVRFCIDVNSKAQVEGKVESLSAGCYLWQRGPFMIELP
jgi:hypothetical protein